MLCINLYNNYKYNIALFQNSMPEKQTLKAGNQEKTSSSSIVSEALHTTRLFKLDSPFVNATSLEKNCPLPAKRIVYERLRFDSDSSESSILPSLENFSPFEKNDAMTDSLVVFLEKEVACRPPTEFRDDSCMTDSLVSLTSDQDPHSILHINGRNEQMTDSLVNFLGPVHCQPPSGFEDSDMSSSIVKIKESDVLPTSDMTSSVLDYLEYVRPSSSLVQSTTSSEIENIPPNICDNNDKLNSNCPKPISDRTEETSKLNLTFGMNDCENDTLPITNECNKTANITFTKDDSLNHDLKNSEDVIPSDANKGIQTANITFTNSVNISRKSRVNGETIQDFKSTKPLSFKSESIAINNNNDRSLKTDMCVRETNIIQSNHKNEFKNLRSCELLTDECQYKNNDAQKKDGSLTKSERFDTFNSSRQIPQRNSTFNTTFTKLKPPSKNSTFVKSTEALNGGLEDDQTSSASDSSFSSGSTKPCSLDELQTIAQRQERSEYSLVTFV